MVILTCATGYSIQTQAAYTHTYKCVHTSMCHMKIISIKIIENSPHDSRRYLLIKALVSPEPVSRLELLLLLWRFGSGSCYRGVLRRGGVSPRPCGLVLL